MKAARTAISVLPYPTSPQELVVRLLVGKQLLKLLLPHCIGAELMASLLPPGGIELNKVLRDFVHRALDLALRIAPFLRAEFVQFGLGRTCRGVFLQNGEFRRQHIESTASAVLYFDIVLGDVVDLDLLHAPVDADSMVLVHHVIARLELRESLDLLALVLFLLRFLLFLGAENIGLRNDREFDVGVLEALFDLPVIGHDLAGIELSLGIFAVERGDPIISKVLCQSSGSRSRRGIQDRPVSFLAVGH